MQVHRTACGICVVCMALAYLKEDARFKKPRAKFTRCTFVTCMRPKVQKRRTKLNIACNHAVQDKAMLKFLMRRLLLSTCQLIHSHDVIDRGGVCMGCSCQGSSRKDLVPSLAWRIPGDFLLQDASRRATDATTKACLILFSASPHPPSPTFSTSSAFPEDDAFAFGPCPTNTTALQTMRAARRVPSRDSHSLAEHIRSFLRLLSANALL